MILAFQHINNDYLHVQQEVLITCVTVMSTFASQFHWILIFCSYLVIDWNNASITIGAAPIPSRLFQGALTFCSLSCGQQSRLNTSPNLANHVPYESLVPNFFSVGKSLCCQFIEKPDFNSWFFKLYMCTLSLKVPRLHMHGKVEHMQTSNGEHLDGCLILRNGLKMGSRRSIGALS